MFTYFGKLLIIAGVSLIILGAILLLGGKVPYFGKLPGDIYIKKGNFLFYAPIVSFLLLSVIISIIFHFVIKIFKR